MVIITLIFVAFCAAQNTPPLPSFGGPKLKGKEDLLFSFKKEEQTPKLLHAARRAKDVDGDQLAKAIRRQAKNAGGKTSKILPRVGNLAGGSWKKRRRQAKKSSCSQSVTTSSCQQCSICLRVGSQLTPFSSYEREQLTVKIKAQFSPFSSPSSKAYSGTDSFRCKSMCHTCLRC
jgi:hypothetical protein